MLLDSVATKTGLDVLLEQRWKPLRGKAVSFVCHQASIASDCGHLLEHVKKAVSEGIFSLQAVFGPQHGLWGHTQDNMIEWEGKADPRWGAPVYSLYGEHREPTDEMLRESELLVFDLFEVGARYYTFLWTLALCLKACERLGLPMLLLDRPNPIGGVQVEGPVLDPQFASFVGMYPLPVRHGMTIGEVGRYLAGTFFPEVRLEVVQLESWDRTMYFEQTGIPWAMPSPNMPSPETAEVYPGGCLLEATNISEGRGTTRPFETFGAAFLDGWTLCDQLNGLGLAGVHFRPIQFQPTFHKFAGQICEGAFVHVTDRLTFKPFLTYVSGLQEIRRLVPDQFAWKQPPYEYEFEKLPIDILAGNAWVREAIENLSPLKEIDERCEAEADVFEMVRKRHLLYR